MNSDQRPAPLPLTRRRTRRQAPTTTDFGRFSAEQYLTHYFKGRCDVEDRFVLGFLHRSFTSIGRCATLLDVGSGPTVYQLISAAATVDQIVASDFLAENRQQIELWKEGAQQAFNWDSRFKFVRQMDRTHYGSLSQMKRSLQSKLVEVLPCDILSSTPLNGAISTGFAVVSAHCCLESITSRQHEFEQALFNLISLVNPGGYLVMTMLKNAHYYRVGGEYFPAFPVDEGLIFELFPKLGIEVLQLETGAVKKGRDYDAILGIVGRVAQSMPKAA